MKLTKLVAQLLVKYRKTIFTHKNEIWTLFAINSPKDAYVVDETVFKTLKKDASVHMDTAIDLLHDELAILVTDNKEYAVCIYDQDTLFLMCEGTGPAFRVTDPLIISQNDIANFPKNKKNIETTIGIFFINTLTLEIPFGSIIEYQQTHIDFLQTIDSRIAQEILNDKITVDACNRCIDNLMFLRSFNKIFISPVSNATLTIPSEIKKLREELLNKYKDQMDDPIITAKIEDTLISAYKKYLKDDPVYTYLQALGSKIVDINLKKTLLIGGVIPDFTTSEGDYHFMQRPLSQGWDPKDFPMIANEIRQGSYKRGFETQQGGLLTKFVLRIFQDVEITEDDCGTKEGLLVLLTKDNWEDYIHTNVITPKGLVDLNETTINQFLNKQVKIRSSLYCKTKNGLCYTCVGSYFKKLNMVSVATYLIQVTSTFMLQSMKAMHGSKVKTIDITDHLAEYFIT